MSILNTFTFRQSQIQRTNLTAHTNHANPFFERQLPLLTGSFRATGSHAIEASQSACPTFRDSRPSGDRTWGYVRAFWLMSVAVVCLIPLVSLPQKPGKADETAAAKAH